MIHTNVTNLDPQRIKESDDRKWERKLFDFAMTLSENEIQLVEEFLSIDRKKDSINLIKFVATHSDSEKQLIKELLGIVLRIPDESTVPCEVVQFKTK